MSEDKVIIDHDKCMNCGSCVNVCPVAVFEQDEEGVKVANPVDCIGCRACVGSCPVDAITVKDE